MFVLPRRPLRRPSNLKVQRLAAFSSVLLFGLVLGCKGGQEAPANKDKASASTPPAKPTKLAPREPNEIQTPPPSVPQTKSTTATQAPHTPDIAVEEVGKDPVELRYQFTAGLTKKFSMKMSVEPKVTINGKTLPATGKTTFDVRGTSHILSVAPDGTARRVSSFDRFTPVAGGLPAQALGQLKSQLGLLAGLKVEEQITSRGLLISAEVIEIPAQDPGMQAMIKNLQDGLSNAVLPLPAQAIGSGGRFRTSTTIEAMGMNLSQTTYFTVESNRDGVLKVKVKTQQSTPPARMDPANLPAGAKVEILSFTGSGEGQVEVNLKTLDMTSDMALSMNIQTRAEGPGAPVPITSTTENKLHVTVQVGN